MKSLHVTYFCVTLFSYDVRHCCQVFFPPSHILTQNMEIINAAESTDNLSECPSVEPLSHSVSLFSARLAPAESSFSLLWEKQKPTSGFLPGEPHGQRSLVGYSPRGRKESNTTEPLHFHFHFQVVSWLLLP